MKSLKEKLMSLSMFYKILIANTLIITVAAVGLSGMGYYLLWVTLGSLISSSVLMAFVYWVYSGGKRSRLGKEDRDTIEAT